MRRVLSYIALAALMFASGAAVYGSLLVAHASSSAVPKKPTDTAATTTDAVVLPGTLVLAQSGALYTLSAGRFRQLTPEDGWMQPSVGPGTDLYAVRRIGASSDVFELGPDGAIVRQLTHDGAPAVGDDLSRNHWAFYPRPGSDGRTVFMSEDAPKSGFEVDLAIWSVTGAAQPRRWTTHDNYTGGDVEPLPLPSGALVYTKYAFDGAQLSSRLWITKAALAVGTPLTAAADDCAQPALAPDGRTMAMICTHGAQDADLVLAPFDGESLGTPRVVASGLPARPAWAPDGSGLAYLAPALAGGPFQLWWLALGGTPTQLTTGLAFDATSAPAWRPSR